MHKILNLTFNLIIQMEYCLPKLPNKLVSNLKKSKLIDLMTVTFFCT